MSSSTHRLDTKYFQKRCYTRKIFEAGCLVVSRPKKKSHYSKSTDIDYILNIVCFSQNLKLIVNNFTLLFIIARKHIMQTCISSLVSPMFNFAACLDLRLIPGLSNMSRVGLVWFVALPLLIPFVCIWLLPTKQNGIFQIFQIILLKKIN